MLAELQRHALLIATAESCTGGLLAGLLTEIPGSSGMVERGFVTYSNAAKTELLGVPPDLIARYGAVSEEVARAMAEGALSTRPRTSPSPSPASPDRTAVHRKSRSGSSTWPSRAKGEATRTHECRFGDIGRCDVRLASVREALRLVRHAVKPGLRHD